MIKKVLVAIMVILILPFISLLAFAESLEETVEASYLQSVINAEVAVEIKKSAIFDASQSFIPTIEDEVSYEWDFGDGNKNQGVEVLHAYKEPGYYDITLTINNGVEESVELIQVFAYVKQVVLITDETEAQERIERIKESAENEGIYLKIIESFGSSTEFISEEVLTKKLTESSNNIQKAKQVIVWTEENAGLNALSRFIQNQGPSSINLNQKTIVVIENNINASTISRTQRQFEVLNPQALVMSKESAIDDTIESEDFDDLMNLLEERGREYEVINSKTGKLRPWNFMSYFVNSLVIYGIPDNTIALLLLLPVIATVVAFMRQVVGVTTFGIYTPSIITLSFLVIGMYAGLLTLLAAIAVGTLLKPLLNKVRMLFIPKMAIVITVVSLALIFIVITSTSLGLFDAQFLSIAIFPMLILSTLVEKFVSSKGEKSFASATVIMASTVIVAIVAYFFTGGSIPLGFTTLKFEFIKNLMLAYPEMIFLLLIINIILGKWTGLRFLERIRFREVLRHIEE